jgi:hypothetical protein
MGATLSLDHMTRQFESGMLRLALQSASLWRDTLALWHPLHTLPMRRISFLDPVTGLFTFLPDVPRPSRLNCQTKRVGSERRGAAYSIGYPMTVVQASIHQLSSQSLSHPLFGQFHFNLMILHLERLGLKFITLRGPSLSCSLLCARGLLYWLLLGLANLHPLLPIFTLSRVARW